MGQKWVPIIGIVLVLGLSVLFGSLFSGTSSPAPTSTPVTPEQEMIDDTEGVKLVGLKARLGELRVKADEEELLRGVEYEFTILVPSKLAVPKWLSRMEVEVAFSGKTSEIVGINSRREKLQTVQVVGKDGTLFDLQVASVYGSSYTDADLEYAMAHRDKEVLVSLYVDGKKVKQLQ
ncbi:hypothetical protein CIG75_04155 [Tumebacillus algifaecis]|uniref:Uncharacterized protein n=1 Tax=Tumebacillus algifaecis TaxID=1214604 RepID=A0A223CYD3_9BACL|nr:hypothetical protein [Tumebacillus algifaecis]ASS74255.1 hypothetical protein CIG75_04155 [Tumebacillus algifaecis]